MGKTFVKIALQVGMAIYQYQQQKKAKAKAARAARVARSNVLINKQSNNDPIYPLYGRQRMGGTRVFIDCSDGAGNIQTIVDNKPNNTTHLNIILAMCEGEIETIEQLWFNDTIVWDVASGGTLTDNSNGGKTLGGFISTTVYHGATMTWNWYPGSLTQTYDTAVSTSVGSSVWGPTHTLTGISYLAMVLTANGNVFGGQMPTFTATCKGKKLLNTAELAEGNEVLVSGADQNPADVMYDYMVDRFYGKGLDRTANGNLVPGLDINLASFKQARLDCAAARSGNGLLINGFLQTEKQLFDNIGEILETCNGMMLFIDGKYEFRIRKKDEQLNLPTSHIFTKDNIIGEMQLQLPNKTAKLNKNTGVFNNPATKFNDDLVIFKSAAFKVEDNGSVLETQEDYTMITNSAQVLDLVTQQVNLSRDLYTVLLTVSHQGMLLKSSDIIEIRHPDFGWGTGAGETQHFFRILELKLKEDNTVEVAATTYNSALEL